MPRFVILEHDHPALHWDLMLEAGPILRTWRLIEPPRPGEAIPAEPSFDHRLAYLDYEGPVSGDRGRVARWDAGTCTWSEEGNVLRITFAGARLRGQAWLGPDATGNCCLALAEAGPLTTPAPCPPPPPAPGPPPPTAPR